MIVYYGILDYGILEYIIVYYNILWYIMLQTCLISWTPADPGGRFPMPWDPAPPKPCLFTAVEKLLGWFSEGVEAVGSFRKTQRFSFSFMSLDHPTCSRMLFLYCPKKGFMFTYPGGEQLLKNLTGTLTAACINPEIMLRPAQGCPGFWVCRSC